MRNRVAVYLSALVLMVGLGLAAGCTHARNDSQIASEIQGKLYGDPAIQSRQISVQSSGGVVTLTGSVTNDAERAAAATQAASVDGVKTVVNNLSVTPTAEQAAAAEPQPEAAPVPAPKARPSASRPRRESVSDVTTHNVASSSGQSLAQNSPPPAPAPAAPATPPPPQKVTIPAGTNVSIRLIDTIDSETAQVGQTFRASLDSPLSADGEVVVPAGYDVEGHVVDVKSAGKFAGRSELTLQLDRIRVGGKQYNIQTSQYHREGSSRGKNTAAKVGTGAAIGAIIGGIAGGGKGAAIGAAAGGGVGGGVQAATKSQQIQLPSETVLSFELQNPVSVIPTTQGPHGDRQKLETNNN
jgi:BON domain-containing protein